MMVLAFPICSQAGSLSYFGKCQYLNADGQLVFNQTCSIDFATFGADGGFTYIVSFSKSSSVAIGEDRQGQAAVNGIPAQVSILGGKVVALTVEGEVFVLDDTDGK